MAGLCSLSVLADQGDAMTANDRNDNLRLCKGWQKLHFHYERFLNGVHGRHIISMAGTTSGCC